MKKNLALLLLFAADLRPRWHEVEQWETIV